jgi:DNA-binding winged helix-turn-helix (wHTH) protein
MALSKPASTNTSLARSLWMWSSESYGATGGPVALPPKAFDLLLVLVENSGHLLEKDELMQRLWPDTFVEEANLPNTISLLRKALAGDGDHPYIETVPRRGYRFVAAVEEISAGRWSSWRASTGLPARASN